MTASRQQEGPLSVWGGTAGKEEEEEKQEEEKQWCKPAPVEDTRSTLPDRQQVLEN